MAIAVYYYFLTTSFCVRTYFVWFQSFENILRLVSWLRVWFILIPVLGKNVY